jgi:alpha-glucosidase (family GH31 glycosyl hydrolase)
MVANLTSQHLKLMVSVWSKFDTDTSFFRNMSAHGYMINGTNYYDAWSAGAREMFYQVWESTP